MNALLVSLVLVTADAGAGRSLPDLVAALSSVETSQVALEELVKRKQEALPHLQGAAMEGRDLAQRGWAIVGLRRIGGPVAAATLKKLSEDRSQPDLVRNWSTAARINMAKDIGELSALSALSRQYAASRRPFKMKVEALAASGGASAEQLLSLAASDYQLQQYLTGPIISLGAAKLIATMMGSKDMNIRQSAAAYVGTVAVKQGKAGNEVVGLAVVKALKFDKGAKEVPWAGGPLYVPNIGWDKRTGTDLVKELIAWYLWCDAHAKKEELSKIEHSLNSISLGSVVGYQADFNAHDAEHWRRILRSVVPANEAARIEGAVR